MITVEIEDVPLMIDVLITYMEGIKEAKDDSIRDVNILDTPEKLLGSMALYDENMATLEKLKGVLESGESRTRSRTRRFIRSLRKNL